MGFGDSVTALLETYSSCLKLLKAFNGAKGDAKRASNESLLRKSIKTDRAQVRRAYSSRLSEAGDRFEKGDGRARSALRRVLKRLTTAIANLLNLSKNQAPVLDYESLLSLSNASRIDAIRAIDQLSHRLGSTPSRGSVASSSSGSSTHRRHHSSSSSASASSTKSTPRDKTRSKKSPKEQKRPVAAAAVDRKSSPRPKVSIKEKPTPAGSGSSRNHSRGGSGSSKTAVANRISLVSISTDSTKLGEIPERRWRRRYDYDTSSEDYNISPVYPLKPYQSAEVKGRSFWGFLRRQQS